MTHNPAALHLDAEYCKQTEFGQILVNSLFTLSLVVGISVNDTTLGTTVANLGFGSVTFPKPVFIGDTLTVKTTVKALRPSKSRPGQGVVHGWAGVGDDGGPRYADFASYCEVKLEKFPLVFYGHDATDGDPTDEVAVEFTLIWHTACRGQVVDHPPNARIHR